MAKYTHESHITTEEEVKDFFHHIVYDLDINIHPDDDFKEYVSVFTGDRTLDDEQTELYNRLIEESSDVCGDDVYDVGCNMLKERMKMN